MNTRTSSLLPILLGAAALGVTSLSALAQGPGPDGAPPEHRGGHRPPSPLFEALDTNHDGVLSADEIKNAPAALMALDKNKDGQLTMDELRPSGPPPRPEGDKGGPDGGPGPDANGDQRPHHGPQDHAEHRPAPPADDADKPAGGPGGPGGPEAREHRGPRPVPPIMDALDTNHDGVISADEIKNAAAALKTLDKNGDGQLTRDELRPAMPPRPPQD